MDWMWVNVLVINFGLQGVVSMHSDGYIGCYTYARFVGYRNSAYIQHNNGNACKMHCFPEYRFAGTTFTQCRCTDSLPGRKVRDGWCSNSCDNLVFLSETCGGVGTFTMYDAQETTTTQTTTTTTAATSTTLTSTTPYVASTDTDTLFNTETSQVVTTDEETSTRSPIKTDPVSPVPTYTIECVLICVSVAVCLVVINNIIICVCKKIRRPKQERKVHVDGYGYISPVNVVDLGDATSDNNALPTRHEGTTNIAGTSSNMYDYVDSKTTESQYTEME